ncbi:hypothetical protein [Paractinoplanes toevensis]|uniref:Uncharacterized protein n=1 Tax=Paractinoplanes toevensis TaxID=571911 RepID=A0A919TFH7_9ACTN|nr:hypothetical protein [Actinoplanes toevensis]GIM93445.1 hypothetical protein Ato02nite_052380 [Actinoplanes toevensis]
MRARSIRGGQGSRGHRRRQWHRPGRRPGSGPARSKVAAVDLNPETLEQATAGHPDISAHPLDVTDRVFAVNWSGRLHLTKAFLPVLLERAARDILDGVEANAYRVLIGKDARMMDKLYRLSPRRAAGLIAGKMQDLLNR